MSSPRGGCQAGILTCFRLCKPVKVDGVCVCVCVFVFAFVRHHWQDLKLYEKSELVFAERWPSCRNINVFSSCQAREHRHCLCVSAVVCVCVCEATLASSEAIREIRFFFAKRLLSCRNTNVLSSFRARESRQCVCVIALARQRRQSSETIREIRTCLRREVAVMQDY